MKKIVMPEALKKLWEKAMRIKYILLIVLAGVLLMLLPKNDNTEQINMTEKEQKSFSLREEEERLAQVLSEIEGAGKVKVMLTVRSSGETVVAQDTDSYTLQEDGETRQENSSEAVIVSEGSQKEATVTLEVIYPQYIGALIVAEGADNSGIKLSLTQAVADLTGLSTDKISVVKMKNS